MVIQKNKLGGADQNFMAPGQTLIIKSKNNREQSNGYFVSPCPDVVLTARWCLQ
jgi:hypothetical protein